MAADDPGAMREYKVKVRILVYGHVTVRAKDEDDAIRIAEELVGYDELTFLEKADSVAVDAEDCTEVTESPR